MLNRQHPLCARFRLASTSDLPRRFAGKISRCVPCGRPAAVLCDTLRLHPNAIARAKRRRRARPEQAAQPSEGGERKKGRSWAQIKNNPSKFQPARPRRITSSTVSRKAIGTDHRVAPGQVSRFRSEVRYIYCQTKCHTAILAATAAEFDQRSSGGVVKNQGCPSGSRAV
jgi:hypothetical protein